MNDPTVGRFLVRDCDARLSVAETDLVRQWIDSGYPFHAVRDHVHILRKNASTQPLHVLCAFCERVLGSRSGRCVKLSANRRDGFQPVLRFPAPGGPL